MVALAQHFADRSKRRVLQITALAAAVAAVLLALPDSDATRVVGTALLAGLTLVSFKAALVANTNVRSAAQSGTPNAGIQSLRNRLGTTDARLDDLEIAIESVIRTGDEARDRADALVDRLETADVLLSRTEPTAAQVADLRQHVAYLSETVDRIQRELGVETPRSL